MAWFTTKVRTANGQVFDIGYQQYPPRHDHPGRVMCSECLVVNAWTTLDTSELRERYTKMSDQCWFKNAYENRSIGEEE